MMPILVSLLLTLRGCFLTRAALHIELLALRHQIHALERSRPRRLRLTRADRLLWVWLSSVWDKWQATLIIVKPETVIAWHRQGFRLFWTWKRITLSEGTSWKSFHTGFEQLSGRQRRRHSQFSDSSREHVQGQRVFDRGLCAVPESRGKETKVRRESGTTNPTVLTANARLTASRTP